jgi:hypothetical protein
MLRRLIRLAVAGAFTSGVLAVGAATAGAQPVSSNGNPVTLVASGLNTPTAFAFGDGTVFEGDGGFPTAGGLYALQSGAGHLLPGSPQFVGGLTWHDGALYLSGGSVDQSGNATFTLQRWSGWNGSSFKHQQVIYTAPAGFQGFNGIGFGANGRLYVGVDVGLLNNNDDGPADTSPYLYDILTFRPNGGDMHVFATGIRQPWQMAFLPGSDDPFVSDLGPDDPAYGNYDGNPPDFLLHVSYGQNYGYPGSLAGPGYAQPFQSFAPHTDVGGVAIFGRRIYLSEFGFAYSPEVVSIPVWGGTPQTLLSGFQAPVIGLAIDGNTLYAGDLTGSVWSVKISGKHHWGWWSGKQHRNRRSGNRHSH